MIVVYDGQIEKVITRESLEKRIAQAIDMLDYYITHVDEFCTDRAYQEYWQSQANSLLSELVRLCIFRDEFDRLENLEGTSA